MELSELCPRYTKCSVNNCPLHSGYPDLSMGEDDLETKCRAQRSVRLKIAADYPEKLRYGGYTVEEYRRKIRRENRTEQEIKKDRERMRKIRTTRIFAPPISK